MRRLFLAAAVLFPAIAHAGFPLGPGGSNGEFLAAGQTELEAFVATISPGDWGELPGTELAPTSYTSGWTVDGSAWKRSYATRPVRVTLTTSAASTCATPPTLTNLVAVADNNTNPGAGNYSYHPGAGELYIGSNPTGLNAYVGGPAVVQEEACIIKVNNGDGLDLWGGQGTRGIFNAWNSGAYDSVGHRAFRHGGGHLAYGGNEVYAFDFDDIRWQRLLDPGPLTVPYGGVYPDNYVPESGPIAKHVYDGFTWFAGKVWLTQQTVGYQCSTCGSEQPQNDDVWSLDPDSPTWVNYTTFADGVGTFSGYGNKVITTVNPVTGNLFGCGADNAPPTYCYEIDSSGVIDDTPADNNFTWLAGNGMLVSSDTAMYLFRHAEIKKIDFDGVSTTVTTVESSLPTALGALTIGDAGIAWVSSRGEFIIWPSAGNIWGYEPATRTFRRYAATAGSYPTNDGDLIYDKFHYLSHVNAFAANNSATDGMWIYKVPDKGDAAEVFTP